MGPNDAVPDGGGVDDAVAVGESFRRAVLGDAHVDASKAKVSEIDADFQEFITRTAWAGVWARPDLDRRTRSLVTISILAALGRDELDLHLRAAANCDVETSEIVEALFHVAVYAGVPAANSAFARLKRIASEPSES